MLVLLRNHCLLLPITHGPLWLHLQHLFPDTKRDARLCEIMTEREGKTVFEHQSYYQRTKNLISLPFLAICLRKMRGIFISLKAESDVTEVD